jgi:hypothetical protein
MSDDVIQRLKQGEFTDEDVALLSDDDIRQLVIHYATMILKPCDKEQQLAIRAAVRQAWCKDWPRPLWERFSKMVLESREIFWARPARINNRFGIS